MQMLDIDHRRLNRMVWRQHPLFAIRFSVTSRLTSERFWLPLATSLGLCMGYGAGVLLPRSSERT